jgi:hypothetical protein
MSQMIANTNVTPSPAPANTTDNGYRLPESATLNHACKLAIVEDKPILMDYWTASIDKTALIGVKPDNEKMLVKSEDEYTSPIAKILKIGKEYIIMTENSIYLVDAAVLTRRVK